MSRSVLLAQAPNTSFQVTKECLLEEFSERSDQLLLLNRDVFLLVWIVFQLDS